ncbi:hypothetical protein [Sphingomonas sp. Ant20]|uniref:hypothetical protein n=1 Tax=Sphingomonas sp. Ant20 TaxID=104605 RepID=UPI000A8C5CDB|nr:hypothetical protein [Sphingomonas sp. Ant20]
MQDPPPRAVAITGRYVVDLMGNVAGGDARGARVLDNLEVTADGDLDRLAGWRGARAHLHVLSNQGGIDQCAGGDGAGRRQYRGR